MANLVSIGLPTYNRADLLEESLESLVNQTYPHIEIIVSDNASPDHTPEVCQKLHERYSCIQYHRNPALIPPAENFKNVLRLARGPYFMWASDDDLWEPDFVATLVDILDRHQHIVLAASETQHMIPDRTRLPFHTVSQRYYDLTPKPQWRRLLRTAVSYQANPFYGIFRREALLTSSGGTVLDFSGPMNYEVPMYVQLAAQGTIYVDKKVLFYKTTPLKVYLHICRDIRFTPHLEPMQNTPTQSEFVPAVTTHGVRNSGLVLRNLFEVCRRQYRHQLDGFKAIYLAVRQIKANPFLKMVLLATYALILTARWIKLGLIWPLKSLLNALLKRARR